MPVNPAGAAIKTFMHAYRLARKSRLLQTRLGQSAFATAYFAYKRYLEDPFYHLSRRHPELFQGGNVLDVGANIGYTALVFSRAIGPGYKVYAFEPEGFNYSLLKRLAESRKAEGRISPILSAVGDRDGIVELWENEHHHADHRIITEKFRRVAAGSRSIMVPIMKIDTFVGQQSAGFPVRFIKIDVQGYELPACRGMEQTLVKNPRATLALEYMPDAMHELGFEAEELISWLRERNFRPYKIGKDGSIQAGGFELSAENGYADVLWSRENLIA